MASADTGFDAAAFEENGYAVIRGALDAATVAAAKERATELMKAFKPSTVSVFTTEEQARSSDAYFLASGGRVSFFFEEGAFDAEGALAVPIERAINKIGHALHDLEPAFQRISYSPAVKALATAAGLRAPQVVQSMYITKQPSIGGAVNAHQDSTFLYTDPPSCLGLWWALEECTEDNGCLFVVPGSHKAGVSRTFRRTEGGGPDAPLTEFHPAEAAPLDVEGAVPLLASPGDLVLLHGAVVHYSHPNTSAASRHAYSVHVVDSGEGVTYPASNWLQRPPGMPFRDLLSTDPEGPPLPGEA